MNLDINVTLNADSSLLAFLGQTASSLLTLVQNAGAVPPSAPAAPGPMSPVATAPTAGANLTRADPSKMAQLVALLQQYGVQAVTQLAPEHYGAFATALRGLGAAI